MFKLLVVFVLFIYSHSTEANEWEQCFHGLEAKLDKYEDSLNKMEDNPKDMSVVYQIPPGGTTVDGLTALINGLLQGLQALLKQLQVGLAGLLGNLGGGSKGYLEKVVTNMLKDQVEIYKPFMEANQKFLNLVNKLNEMLKKPEN